MNPKTVPHADAFTGDQGGGLTKREYFACHILSGTRLDVGDRIDRERAVTAAVEAADALIAALNATPGGER